MSKIGLPVFEFSRLKPISTTVIVTYDVDYLNLPALFALLPVTFQSLPTHLNLQKKQGKIRLPPELNCPGEILSMRYDGQVRGIVRSEKARSFPHSIIIDIGTSERIISVKLSKTLELTGPTTMEIAREGTEYIIGHVKKCQSYLNLIKNNKELAIRVKNKFLYAISGGTVDIQSLNQTEMEIWKFYETQTKGYTTDKAGDFLEFIIDFDRDLYSGTLEIHDMESEMVNIQFNLGFSINTVAFARIMNQDPFLCKFTNAKTAAAVNVYYNYTKLDRITGLPKESKHTIRVNKSGHVRHSGPNLRLMEPVYYTFIQRVLQSYNLTQSVELDRKQLRLATACRSLSLSEWKHLLNDENKLREKILIGLMPTVDLSSETSEPEHKTEEPLITVDDVESVLQTLTTVRTVTVEAIPLFSFDYQPLLSQ